MGSRDNCGFHSRIPLHCGKRRGVAATPVGRAAARFDAAKRIKAARRNVAPTTFVWG
jgi:hypothetical protein